MTKKTADFLDEAKSWTIARRRGQLVFDTGDSSRQMYRVESGCVRLQVNGVAGARQIVVFLFSGDLFGYEVEGRVCSAEAASDCVLRCWSMRAILKLSDRQPRLTVRLLEAAQHRFHQMAEHIDKLAHLDASERVIWFLNGLLSCKGLQPVANQIHLPMTHIDIADYLAIAPETLSRSLTTLEGEGYFHREGRSDLVLNPSAFIRIRNREEFKSSVFVD